MTTVKNIYNFIDQLAPFRLQENYDNSGLCIGDPNRTVTNVLLALDCTVTVTSEAVSKNCDLIITHHPVIFKGIKHLSLNSVPAKLAAAGISVLSAHTNFDSAVMNDILCRKLSLTPIDHIAEENGAKMGCICNIPPISPHTLSQNIRTALGNTVVRYNRTPFSDELISKVAVCSGSGGSFLQNVIDKGCNAFITGDVKHDVFIDAFNAGITVFDAGHFHTENIFCDHIQSLLRKQFPDLNFSVSENSVDILDYTL